MVKPIFDELAAPRPKRHFTVGIYDDVTHLSLPIDGAFRIAAPGRRGPGRLLRARLGRHGRSQQGLGQDHRREHRPVRPGLLRLRLEEVGLDHRVAPALRPAADPLDLSRRRGRLRRLPPVRAARPDQGPRVRQARARRSCSTPRTAPTRSGTTCPASVQRQLIDKEHRLLGDRCPRRRRRGRHGQPDQHRHAAVLLQARRASCRRTRRSRRSRRFVEKTYAKRGEAVVARNFAAIDRSLERLGHVDARRRHQRAADHDAGRPTTSPTSSPGSPPRLMAGDGDQLPVSALPVDGTFPTGTAKYEKRAIAQMIPIWDPAICIDCGKCAMVCPHATIRMKVFPTAAVERRRRPTSCTRSSGRASSPTTG